MIVRGLFCVSEVNCTGTFSLDALVKVLEPNAEVPFAKTCRNTHHQYTFPYSRRQGQQRKGQGQTHRKPHLPMLPQIPHIPIHHHTLSTQILCPRAHQTSPTRRVETFWLRNKHYCILVHSIYKVLRWLWRGGVGSINHLHCIGRSEDFCGAGLGGGGVHA